MIDCEPVDTPPAAPFEPFGPAPLVKWAGAEQIPADELPLFGAAPIPVDVYPDLPIVFAEGPDELPVPFYYVQPIAPGPVYVPILTTLAPTPEPETWALMAIGLGLVALRRM